MDAAAADCVTPAPPKTAMLSIYLIHLVSLFLASFAGQRFMKGSIRYIITWKIFDTFPECFFFLLSRPVQLFTFHPTRWLNCMQNCVQLEKMGEGINAAATFLKIFALIDCKSFLMPIHWAGNNDDNWFGGNLSQESSVNCCSLCVSPFLSDFIWCFRIRLSTLDASASIHWMIQFKQGGSFQLTQSFSLLHSA